MRLFIAAELPTCLKECLAETAAGLRERVRGRFVPYENYHVTLAFLGEVEGAGVERVGAAMHEACAGAVPFEVRLGAFGMFGKPAKATLWQTVEDAGELPALEAALRRELGCIGIELGQRRYVPHVTLARGVQLEGADLGMPRCGTGQVERVTLFKSELSPDGAAYTPLLGIELM